MSSRKWFKNFIKKLPLKFSTSLSGNGDESTRNLGLERQAFKLLNESAQEKIILNLRNFLSQFKPFTEEIVVRLFDKYKTELGFGENMLNRHGYGYDRLMKWNGKQVRVEFERTSKDFIWHGHDPEQVDLVICWCKDREIPVQVLELADEIPKILKNRLLRKI